MHPVLHGIAKLFIGGELSMQNGYEGYAYRGKIAAVEFIDATSTTSASLKVVLEWNVKADGQRVAGGYVPTNGWDEVTSLVYECDVDQPNPKIGAPNLPNVTFDMHHAGWMRMIIDNSITGDVTELFPKGTRQLNQTNVRWLADGPKAKADEAHANNVSANVTS